MYCRGRAQSLCCGVLAHSVPDLQSPVLILQHFPQGLAVKEMEKQSRDVSTQRDLCCHVLEKSRAMNLILGAGGSPGDTRGRPALFRSRSGFQPTSRPWSHRLVLCREPPKSAFLPPFPHLLFSIWSVQLLKQRSGFPLCRIWPKSDICCCKRWRKSRFGRASRTVRPQWVRMGCTHGGRTGPVTGLPCFAESALHLLQWSRIRNKPALFVASCLLHGLFPSR